MITTRRRGASAIALLLAGVALPAGVSARQAQTPASASTPQTQSIPGLSDYKFTLPNTPPTPDPQPTIAPLPRPTPRPTPTSTPTPTPSPRATPTPRATPSPTARANPTPVAQPTASATPDVPPAPESLASPSAAGPVPVPTAVATPAPTATASATQEPSAGGLPAWLPWLVAALAIGVAAVVILRRRSGSEPVVIVEADAPPAAPPAPREASATPRSAPPVASPPPLASSSPPAPMMLDRDPGPTPLSRPQLALSLAPRRAGFNLITATVEGELLVRNVGNAPVAAIRIGAALMEAGAGRESEVAGFFAQPVVRPATPPFTLAPGEERRVRVVVARGRDQIRGVPANGRAMFVPVVAINALHGAGDAPGQAARGFAIGVERADSDRLVPFWLDLPPRMYDGLAVRPYGPAVDQ